MPKEEILTKNDQALLDDFEAQLAIEEDLNAVNDEELMAEMAMQENEDMLLGNEDF